MLFASGWCQRHLTCTLQKTLNISKTKQDNEKLKTQFRVVWKYCSVSYGSTIFWLEWNFNFTEFLNTFQICYHYFDHAVRLGEKLHLIHREEHMERSWVVWSWCSFLAKLLNGQHKRRIALRLDLDQVCLSTGFEDLAHLQRFKSDLLVWRELILLD